MEWFRAFHLIGIVLWFGSLLQVTRMLKSHARAPEGARATLHDIERRTQLFIGFPGLLIVLLTGIHMLMQGDPAAYFKQGWFHMKLTLVLVAVGIDVALFRAIRSYKDEPKGVLGPLLMHIFAGLCLIGLMIAVKVMGAR